MLKRAFDFTVALAGLILLSPLIASVALIVRVRMGSPILFHQLRPGLHGKPFKLFKFRTMVDAYGSDGRLLSDSERLTATGRALRATSLDELPQLLNVLRGDISLVGPRPLLMTYLDRYSPQEARRHEVRPGLTGLAQVEGRNSLSWEEKFRLDVWYVDHQSLALDLKILLKTIVIVLRRSGVNSADAATMPEFLGHGRSSPTIGEGEGRPTPSR